VREVGSSNPGRGIIVGKDFHPTRQLARLSPANMLSNLNLFRISPHGETVNHRPYASPSLQVAKPRKITAILTIIIFNNQYSYKNTYTRLFMVNSLAAIMRVKFYQPKFEC